MRVSPLASRPSVFYGLIAGRARPWSGDSSEFSLDSQDCPSFITTSYVWGERKPKDQVHIEVNGVKLPVGPSVPPILELIRDHADFEKVQWICIDGICISQDDKVEKNAQVEMMEISIRSPT
jgi:hypothetical protein